MAGATRTSRLDPYGILQHACDLDLALGRMRIDRPVVVGHSMGAYVAAALAAFRPGWQASCSSTVVTRKVFHRTPTRMRSWSGSSARCSPGCA